LLITEATVSTGRAVRHLVQLCRHIDEIAGQHPGMDATVDWSDGAGEATFGGAAALCAFRATPDALILRAEAADIEHLNRITRLVGDRLELIGRHDRLTVNWQPAHR